jgi:hypothetical protein
LRLSSAQHRPAELKKKLDKHGLKASQLDVSFPINRWECIDFIQQGILYSGLVGIPFVDTTDGKYKLEGVPDKEQLDFIKYHIRQCLPWAENHKVVINVEPHGPFTTQPETLFEIVEHFESEYVQINFDTGNTFISGKDPLEFLKACEVRHPRAREGRQQGTSRSGAGKSTGISASVVHIGEGVNAPNIAKCIEYLTETIGTGSSRSRAMAIANVVNSCPAARADRQGGCQTTGVTYVYHGERSDLVAGDGRWRQGFWRLRSDNGVVFAMGELITSGG